jgi:predicted TIM-barrel fold metal-dependent hydrolase
MAVTSTESVTTESVTTESVTTGSVTTERKTKRILVSADAHGGAPIGELMGVLSRDAGAATAAAPGDAPGDAPADARADAMSKMAARFRFLNVDDGSGLNRDPQVQPEDRLREMARDGVSAEVIYGMTGTFPGETLDATTARCARTNDWMAETYGSHLDVMAPSIALPLPTEPHGGGDWEAPAEEHIAAAAAELRRAAAMGLRPGLMPDTSPKLGYNRPDWNPIWEAACEADIPLSFHVGFGTNPVRNRNPGGAVANYTTVASNIIGTVAQLCASGVLANFPELKVVMTECNAGWLAWVMMQMDEAHVKHGHWAKPKLEMPPSEYARRQVQVTFQEDPIGVANRHYTGLRCLMWGSDYPHWEGTWPNSEAAVDKLFVGVPEDEVDQIVHRNAVETFGFKLPR